MSCGRVRNGGRGVSINSGVMGTGPFSAITLRVRPVGITVDFCPVCRRERSFRFAEACQHRYMLFFNRGPVGHAHHELTCTGCGAILERDVDERPVTMTVTSGSGEVREPEVLPLVRQRIADWEDMERRRQSGKLRADEREEMIRTAMLSFSRLYDEQLTARLHPATLTAVIVFMVALAGTAAWVWMDVRNHWVVAGLLVAIVGALGLALVYIRHKCPRTKARRWVAAALAPLDPSEEEIAAIKREMLTHRLRAGVCVKPWKMRKAIDKERVRMGLARPA